MRLSFYSGLQLIFCFLFLFILKSPVSASVNVILETQADVDNYRKLNPRQVITGNLCIGNASNTSDISSLKPLMNLSKVGGNVIIQGTLFLHSLEGLESLGDIRGSLHVEANAGLSDISSLLNLQRVGGSIVIDGNFNLKTLRGLNSIRNIVGDLKIWGNGVNRTMGYWPLESIGGSLYIYLNPDLVDLEIFGWKSLREVWQIRMAHNNSLSSLKGLGSLINVEHNLVIENNQNLTSLKGLQRLESIGTSLSVSFCDGLRSLQGLESIRSIGENLDTYGYTGAGVIFASNAGLRSLEGIQYVQQLYGFLNINNCNSLHSLEYTEEIPYSNLTNITLRDNADLFWCNSDMICNYIRSREPIVIMNNAIGCNTIDQVTDACR